jgi:hypothetical protein
MLQSFCVTVYAASRREKTFDNSFVESFLGGAVKFLRLLPVAVKVFVG